MERKQIERKGKEERWAYLAIGGLRVSLMLLFDRFYWLHCFGCQVRNRTCKVSLIAISTEYLGIQTSNSPFYHINRILGIQKPKLSFSHINRILGIQTPNQFSILLYEQNIANPNTQSILLFTCHGRIDLVDNVLDHQVNTQGARGQRHSRCADVLCVNRRRKLCMG